MEFMDEKIQVLLNEAEKAKEPHDIRTGSVRVGKRYYTFEEQPFFDGKLTMYIPQDFTDIRIGRCIDNGPMESFWGTLKCFHTNFAISPR
ncbi:hypothetical protein [Paenibacillus dendritiformis]|uniref:hypothetical protein n=1 Tax=Paenibacillus dendritiformis TaxID=130049 RepID=UPI0018CE3F86|nr:hypothetical protein [Paenibacillus dendritiformis]